MNRFGKPGGAGFGEHGHDPGSGAFGRPGQFGGAGQAGQTGQPGQFGRAGQTGQPGQFGGAGHTGQPGQFGGSGHTGQFGHSGRQPEGFGDRAALTNSPDYRLGGIQPGADSRYRKPFAQRMADMRITSAPWPVLIALALQVIAVGVIVWRLVALWKLPVAPPSVPVPPWASAALGFFGTGEAYRPENIAGITAFWTLACILVLVMAVFAAKGENWARIVSTGLCAAGAFLLLSATTAVAGLAAVVAVPLLWLPANKRWYGTG